MLLPHKHPHKDRAQLRAVRQNSFPSLFTTILPPPFPLETSCSSSFLSSLPAWRVLLCVACRMVQSVHDEPVSSWEGEGEGEGGGYPTDSWQLDYNVRVMAAVVLLQLLERCVRWHSDDRDSGHVRDRTRDRHMETGVFVMLMMHHASCC